MLHPDVPGLYRLHWVNGRDTSLAFAFGPNRQSLVASESGEGWIYLLPREWESVERAELILAAADKDGKPANDLILSALTQAVARDTLDALSADALADWLSEHALETTAGRVRRLCPENGDILVMTYPAGSKESNRTCRDAVKKLQDMLLDMERRVLTAVLPDSTTLVRRAFPEAILRLAATNPVVAGCLQAARDNRCDLIDAMISMVTALAQQNATLMQQQVEYSIRNPPTLIPDRQAGTIGAALDSLDMERLVAWEEVQRRASERRTTWLEESEGDRLAIMADRAAADRERRLTDLLDPQTQFYGSTSGNTTVSASLETAQAELAAIRRRNDEEEGRR